MQASAKAASETDSASSALQQHWLGVPSGDMQGQWEPALATMQRPCQQCQHHSPEARDAWVGGAGLPQGIQGHNSSRSPSAEGLRQDIPSAGTESSDGSYRLKLPVNIYRAFGKALGAQPNFNHQTDIVAD